MSTCREPTCSEQHGLIEGFCEVHALDLESMQAGLTSRPWGNAVVIQVFIPGPPRKDDLSAAEAAVGAALADRMVEMHGWFERLEIRPVREETMGQ